MLDYKELAKTYRECSKSGDEPRYMVLPEGVFMRDVNGIVEVYAYDEEGNHYLLDPEEQLKRIGKAIDRMQKK